MNLDTNRLSGPIPPEIGQLGGLTNLSIAKNELVGSIPLEIAQLQSLTHLDLGLNQLSGTVPPEIGQLTNLTWLRFASNLISGPIPPEIAQLEKLEYFDFEDNPGLIGPLPEAMTKLKNLDTFYFDRTQICVPATSTFREWLSGVPVRSSDHTICPSPQRDALIALYDKTDGPNWTHSTNWKSLEPLNQWHGLTTDAEDRVTGIDLENNNLNGSLPSQMSNLKNLKSLNLSFNQGLSGAIPLSFQRIGLEELLIEGSQICVPQDDELQQWLSGITQEDFLYCNETRRDYYSLAALYNTTNGPEWGNNTNWLTDEPLNTWYGVVTNDDGEVTHLNLGGNNLQGSVSDIGQLQKLETLNLKGNKLTGGISPEIGRLHNLRILDLSGNQLIGGIPSEVFQMHNLIELHLNSNNLTNGIPSEIAQLESIEILNLASNPLSGNIPPEIGQLQHLAQLRLNGNLLTGGIPIEFGQLVNLRYLNVGSNKLTGSIPGEIGQLDNLEILGLQHNRFSGDIPPQIGLLLNLRGLWLEENQLSGVIPSDIGQLESLVTLSLSKNQHSGPIPSEIGQLQNLSELNLVGNILTGPIPSEIGQLQNTKVIRLNDNRLNGSIPPELGELQNLTRLFLHSNELTGQIPSEMGQLSNLEELRLSHNQLTGNIPESFGELASLRSLHLTDNTEMSGTLPMALTLLEFDELLLGGTNLCVPDVVEFRNWLRATANSRVARCENDIIESRFYLTQATQSFGFPVPLIAGEDAFLRVFVQSNSAVEVTMPLVRATFYQDGFSVHTVEIPGSGKLIPGEIDEGELTASANVRIPGSMLLPGLEMVIEVDPDGELDPSLGIPERLPPTGRISMDVHFMPSFELTLVPFLWTVNPDRDILAQVEGLSSESEVFRYTHDLLPVGEFNLEIREPVWTSVEPVFRSCRFILAETAVVRAMDGTSGHYMGVLTDYGGIARVPGNESVSALIPETIAHEIGHNFNLQHAPCGNPPRPDPDFPYQFGSTGEWGYDLLNETLISPDTPDLMSYCGPPNWISDYSFNRAASFRLTQARNAQLAAAFTPSTRSLLLWGGVTEEGDLVLEPAFVVDAPPTVPDLVGPYLLRGEDLGGGTLFNLSFGMAEIADGEGGAFAFIVPMQSDWVDQLRRITLSGPEGVVILGGDENEEEQDTPSAALLLDSVTGNVRGILRDWQEPGITGAAARRVLPEPGLDVVISKGVPAPSDWD